MKKEKEYTLIGSLLGVGIYVPKGSGVNDSALKHYLSKDKNFFRVIKKKVKPKNK